MSDLNPIRTTCTRALLVAGSLLALNRPTTRSRQVMRRGSSAPALAGIVTLVLALGAETAAAQSRPVPDTFTATTTGMTPSGLTLKIDVLEWSDEAARAAVIAALASEADDVSSRLAELPTVGVVWRSGAAVGHSVKLAHREPHAGGGERMTFVTDKPLDAYSFEPWTTDGGSARERLAYSVIELRLGDAGSGEGSISLAADVELDAESQKISLVRGDAPNVLTAVTRAPKPYWAQGG